MTRAHQCLEFEALGTAVDLPAEDPRRGDIDACPRCAARLASYARFVAAPSAVPHGADLDDARARLEAFVEREIFGAPAPDGRAGAVGDAMSPSGARRRRSVRPAAWWTGRAARPVWAVAVLVVAVATFALLRDPAEPDRESVLRGDPESGVATRDPGRAMLDSDPAETPGSGGILLRWTAHPGADRYEVELLTLGLEPTSTLDARAESSLSIDVTALRALAPAGTTLYWRVIASGEGRTLASSSPRTLVVP